jgi:glucose/arabinose dehydrogenase
MRFRIAIAGAVAVAAAALLAGGCGGEDDAAVPPTTSTTPTTASTGDARPASRGERELLRAPEPRLETVATGLEVPWDMAFLPDGSALVTERPGRVRLLSARGELDPDAVAEIPVLAEGEGGLLGIAVDPRYERNSFVYVYRTTESGNEVVRLRHEGGGLSEDGVVLHGIPAASIHDGGRIRFGPDDRLYVATGDAAQDESAQDPASPSGKLLALEPDEYRGDGGNADPEVVSLGHRNPQGFAWHPETGRLYENEHGPEGFDELNLIEPGGNYGWPAAVGPDHEGFVAPLTTYEESIAPSGATFVTLPGSEWTGDYLVGALVGEQIRRLRFDGTEVTLDEPLFEGVLGRVRAVVEGSDGALYALTSNRDGRGTPTTEDDRIARIIPPAN